MFELTPFGRRDELSFFRPFHDLSQLEKAFFGNSDLSGFRTDIKDLGDSYELEAELPGFSKEDIQVDIQRDTLTISARHNAVKEEKDENNQYVCRERSWGAYTRSFDISGVRQEEISAAYENGILKLHMPKQEKPADHSRRLEIQ